MDRNRFRTLSSFFAGVVATLVVGVLVAAGVTRAAGRYDDLSLLASVISLVRTNYIDDVDEHTLLRSARTLGHVAPRGASQLLLGEGAVRVSLALAEARGGRASALLCDLPSDRELSVRDRFCLLPELLRPPHGRRRRSPAPLRPRGRVAPPRAVAVSPRRARTAAPAPRP